MTPTPLAAPVAPPRVLVFATLGHGSTDERRILDLLRDTQYDVFPFSRSRKWASIRQLLGVIRRTRPDLILMEGTGLAGGLGVLLGRVLFGSRYVVSSGDAVGPFVGMKARILGPLFALYERILCRLADGFIGWTPYLTGRALTFGTPRAMTAAGWAPFTRTPEVQAADRVRIRAMLGIPPEQLVIGIAGSMVWARRFGYCYGGELVEAARLVHRSDVTFLLVGDGDGKSRLEQRAAGLPAGRVLFTGRIPRDELPGYYAAMDIGSLPQSVDRVGSFRYTTKLSEYLAFRLPVVTGQIPLAYDLDGGWLWRLPGTAPWDRGYVAALARLADSLDPAELAAHRSAVPTSLWEFDQASQVARVTAFLRDLQRATR